MIRETFRVGLLGCNCTILGDDETTREAIVIDPGAEMPKIVNVLDRHKLKVVRIVVTHAHIDHIAGAAELKALTGAPVIYSEDDLPLVGLMGQQAAWLGLPVPEVHPPDHSPADGDVIALADLRLHVLLTPGHSPGSISLHLPAARLLLAGDTLFQGAIGRTDLPGGDELQLLASIRERFLPLPGNTLVIPGHGPATTVAAEKASNPFLR